MRPPSDLLERFRRDLAALAPAPGRLGVAVSGGPDSIALLLLSAAALPGEVEAATVDHCLRPTSGAEATAVADLCLALGCPHATLVVAVPDGPAGLQAEARRARYDALRGWAGERALPLLATAHHADDQAETVLMRLQRGAGVAGLSGIRPLRPEGPSLAIVRPLLGWANAELAALVEQAGVAAVADPSNADPRFDRVVVRRFLAANPQFEPARLARSAAACREADAALGWAAGQLAEDRLTHQGEDWRLDVTGLPRDLRRRLLVHTVAAIRDAHGLLPPWTGGEDVEGLLVPLEAGAAATRAGVMARAYGPIWTLRPAPPRRPSRA